MPSCSGFLPKEDMPAGRAWNIHALVVMATGFGVGGLGSCVQRRNTCRPRDVLRAVMPRGKKERNSGRQNHKFLQECFSLLTSHTARRADHPPHPEREGFVLSISHVKMSLASAGVTDDRGVSLSEPPRIRPLKITLGLQFGGGSLVRIIRCVSLRHQPTEPPF